MNIENNSTLLNNSKLESYNEKDLRKIYRVLKGKLLNPSGYETHKYKLSIWELSKNISDILKSESNLLN